MELYAHQKAIIADNKAKTGLWLGTGAGKTRIALLLAHGKTLVIAPKTQKEDGNWEREKDELGLQLDLTVISKETFRRDAHTLSRFDTVIGEEAHTILGVTSQTRWRKKVEIPKTSQLFEELDVFLGRTQPSRLYLCTATIMRSPMTVWGAAHILGRDWDYWQFRQTFYTFIHEIGPRGAWIAKTDERSKERLAEAVKKLGYVGRLEDYFDVPEQTYRTDWLELTVSQKDRIKDMRIEYPDPMVRANKIHQIENGILSGDEWSADEEFSNNKIDKLLDYGAEFTRMIVFARYTNQIHQIVNAFRGTGKDVFVLNGETKERGKLFEAAKLSQNYVFIAQSSISAGWELPDCPVMIFASRTYSFVDEQQALGRIQRSDNIKKNLYIYLVVRGGTDEACHQALLEKNDFNEKLYAKNI